MYAEEFILIPRKIYAPDEKTAPQSQILHNPLINDKSSQLNYIQRFRERNISRDSPPPLNPTSPIPLTPNNVVPNLRKRNLSALTNFRDDCDDEAEKILNHTIHCSRQAPREQKKNDEKINGKTAEVFRKVMESIQELLEANKLERANIVLKQLFKVESLTLDVDGYVLIQGKPTLVKIESFLYDTQQNTKKLEGVFYPQILKELNLDPSLVSNTYAKQILRPQLLPPSSPTTTRQLSTRRDLNPPLRRLDRQLSNPKPSNSTKEKPRKKNFSPPPTTTMTTMIKTMKAVKNRLRRRQQKNGNPTISEEKKLKLLYTKGPAAFGSVKNLTNASQLSPKKVKTFLRSQSSHTKYGLFRKTYPRLKVIVNDINEIWSLDLAYVDELAKYNRGVRYLLVAVDCLSRYLRVEPLKTKYAKETTEAFKKMIKTKQPKNVWVDKGTEFKGEFEKLCTKREIIKYNTHTERNIRSIKSIMYKHLEFEWTYSYIEKLQSFVQTINLRVNRVTKLAPNKVTRKHVPALVSLIANSSSKLVQKPKFYVGDYVRIAKTDLPFRKGYKQIFTDEVFELVAIPTVNPPTYSLIDAEKEEISGKFYEKELSLIGNKADYNENGQ